MNCASTNTVSRNMIARSSVESASTNSRPIIHAALTAAVPAQRHGSLAPVLSVFLSERRSSVAGAWPSPLPAGPRSSRAASAAHCACSLTRPWMLSARLFWGEQRRPSGHPRVFAWAATSLRNWSAISRRSSVGVASLSGARASSTLHRDGGEPVFQLRIEAVLRAARLADP